MRNASGELKLVDLFYAAGQETYRVLLEDPARIAEAFPPGRREYLLDIAAVARMSTPDELATLRTAAESIGGQPPYRRATSSNASLRR